MQYSNPNKASSNESFIHTGGKIVSDTRIVTVNPPLVQQEVQEISVLSEPLKAKVERKVGFDADILMNSQDDSNKIRSNKTERESLKSALKSSKRAEEE